MAEKRCVYKCGAWNCGSYQFNLYKDDIDQGELCDVHYWQTKAQRPWQGLTDEERNACLVSADPCEALADPEAKQLMEDIEAALRSKNK